MFERKGCLYHSLCWSLNCESVEVVMGSVGRLGRQACVVEAVRSGRVVFECKPVWWLSVLVVFECKPVWRLSG